MLEAQHESLMVDPGGQEGDLLLGDPHDVREHGLCVADGMADADDLGARKRFVHRPGHHRHRVGVVQQPRVGAAALHLVSDTEHHGDGPQAAEDAADAEGVGDGLPHAVPVRDLEVQSGGSEAADVDLVHDIVGAVERRAELRRGHDDRVGPDGCGGRLRDAIGRVEPLGIDVVQDQPGTGELGDVNRSAARLRPNSTLPDPRTLIVVILSHHRRLATVDHERRARDERGVVGGQERVGGGDLVGARRRDRAGSRRARSRRRRRVGRSRPRSRG